MRARKGRKKAGWFDHETRELVVRWWLMRLVGDVRETSIYIILLFALAAAVTLALEELVLIASAAAVTFAALHW